MQLYLIGYLARDDGLYKFGEDGEEYLTENYIFLKNPMIV